MRTHCFSSDIPSLCSRQSSNFLPDVFYKRTKTKGQFFLLTLMLTCNLPHMSLDMKMKVQNQYKFHSHKCSNGIHLHLSNWRLLSPKLLNSVSVQSPTGHRYMVMHLLDILFARWNIWGELTAFWAVSEDSTRHKLKC